MSESFGLTVWLLSVAGCRSALVSSLSPEETPALLSSTNHTHWAYLNWWCSCCLESVRVFISVCIHVCVSLSIGGHSHMVHGAQVTLFTLVQGSLSGLCLTVEQKRGAVQQRQAEGLFIDHLWPTWQQEGDDDKERNYGGQGRANKKIGHPTRMK